MMMKPWGMILVNIIQANFLPCGQNDAEEGRRGSANFDISLGKSTIPFFSKQTKLKVIGFCAENAPESLCKGEGCCCWSPFGAVEHPACPNAEEPGLKRKYLFAPEGTVFVKQAGDQAKGERYDQRDLCCLVDKVSPEYFTKVPMVEAMGDTISVSVAPTMAAETEAQHAAEKTAAAPQDSEAQNAVPPMDDEEREDLTSTEMEAAANANVKAAAQLTEATESLGAASDELKKMHKEHVC